MKKIILLLGIIIVAASLLLVGCGEKNSRAPRGKAFAGQAVNVGPGSCEGECGKQVISGGGSCWCDNVCSSMGDCCGDKAEVCGGAGNAQAQGDAPAQSAGGATGVGTTALPLAASITLQQCHEQFPTECQAPQPPQSCEILGGFCTQSMGECTAGKIPTGSCPQVGEGTAPFYCCAQQQQQTCAGLEGTCYNYQTNTCAGNIEPTPELCDGYEACCIGEVVAKPECPGNCVGSGTDCQPPSIQNFSTYNCPVLCCLPSVGGGEEAPATCDGVCVMSPGECAGDAGANDYCNEISPGEPLCCIGGLVDLGASFSCEGITSGTNADGAFTCNGDPGWCRTDNTNFADCMSVESYEAMCTAAGTCEN